MDMRKMATLLLRIVFVVVSELLSRGRKRETNRLVAPVVDTSGE